MKCPKCKKPGVKMLVAVYVDIPAGWTNVSKSGIRSPEVRVSFADWPRAVLHCKCGWNNRRGKRNAE